MRRSRSCLLLASSVVCLLLSACQWLPGTDDITDSMTGRTAFEPDGPDVGFRTTDSGLRYRILKKTDGKYPSVLDKVTVRYRGWLDDGTEFDSSQKRGKPMTARLDTGLKGWTEGVQLIREGGRIELEIPPELGYDKEGRPPSIPPNATLHFEIELVKIESWK